MTTEGLRALPGWQDGAPAEDAYGFYAAQERFGVDVGIVEVNEHGTWGMDQVGPLQRTDILRHAPLPDVGALIAERDRLRADWDNALHAADATSRAVIDGLRARVKELEARMPVFCDDCDGTGHGCSPHHRCQCADRSGECSCGPCSDCGGRGVLLVSP